MDKLLMNRWSCARAEVHERQADAGEASRSGAKPSCPGSRWAINGAARRPGHSGRQGEHIATVPAEAQMIGHLFPFLGVECAFRECGQGFSTAMSVKILAARMAQL